MTTRRTGGAVRSASLLAVAAAAALSLTACQTGGDDDTGPDGKAGAVITRSIGDGVAPGAAGTDTDRVSVVLGSGGVPGSADVIRAHT